MSVRRRNIRKKREKRREEYYGVVCNQPMVGNRGNNNEVGDNTRRTARWRGLLVG